MKSSIDCFITLKFSYIVFYKLIIVLYLLFSTSRFSKLVSFAFYLVYSLSTWLITPLFPSFQVRCHSYSSETWWKLIALLDRWLFDQLSTRLIRYDDTLCFYIHSLSYYIVLYWICEIIQFHHVLMGWEIYRLFHEFSMMIILMM